jgi:spore coat protein A
MKDKSHGPTFTRREVIKLGAAGGAAFFLSSRFGSVPHLFAQAAGPLILDPASIPQFVTPLLVPPAMPRTAKIKMRNGKQADYYEIAVRQFTQQILPAGFGATTVWSYCSKVNPAPVTAGGTLHYPALTIEAKADKPNRIKWINELVDASDAYLPHILPVDQTLHWANPPGGVNGRDNHGHDATPYTGPVPIVTHLHGAHVSDVSDGFPEAWYLPAAGNIPLGFAMNGGKYDAFKAKSPLRTEWTAGSAVFEYPNDQRAATLWFHDHTLGMTRVNVYAGPAGFYILRGGPADLVTDSLTGTPAVLPGPAPALGDLPGTKYYEIPIVIQDRSFTEAGQLFYPDNRAFFEGVAKDQLDIPFLPDHMNSDISPIWNPEFFGNTMVVNGYTWPFADIEQRRYRFRLLNGSDSRFLILKFDHPGAEVWQLGSDQGFLAAPVNISGLTDVAGTALDGVILLAPAERADIIVDFTNVPVGATVQLINLGPDEPFGGGVAGVDFPLADPATTGRVMEFRVGPVVGQDLSTPPARLVLPAIAAPAGAPPRSLSLNELMSMMVQVPFDPAADAFVYFAIDPATNRPALDANGKYIPADPAEDTTARLIDASRLDETKLPDGVIFDFFGPMMAQLGTFDPAAGPIPMSWTQPVSENPAVNTSEVWEFYNFTADAHPIHVHLVQFQVVNRQPIDENGVLLDVPRGPEPWESGFKDTVISYPGEVTRVQATFDMKGLYVWHCHILSHEDNEMMRPFQVI